MKNSGIIHLRHIRERRTKLRGILYLVHDNTVNMSVRRQTEHRSPNIFMHIIPLDLTRTL